MNELFDKLIIRIMFAVFICLTFIIYKYLHFILFPSTRQQLFKRFYPSKNAADSLHLFARIIGISLIYSELYLSLTDGVLLALFDFAVMSISTFIIYLLSLYIIESIALYNFEYNDEIVKRKNFAYAMVCFAHAIGIAYIIKTTSAVAKNSIIMIIFLWLFSLVITGFVIKAYQIFSKLHFNKLIIQKNMSVAFSYSGFFLGWTFIISSSLNHNLQNLGYYSMQTLLQILLSIIIFPIFRKGLIYIFRVKEDLPDENDIGIDTHKPKIGYGVYEGAILFTSCFLTAIVTGNIHFGTFYHNL